MRNKVMIWMALVVALVMQGCQKEPINNDIEGFWQLEQFVVKDTREVVYYLPHSGEHDAGWYREEAGRTLSHERAR